ncbi:hypothetical protein VNO78_27301 [Psophocarpus tetragonolobus]|uniref:Uncharacterized protein n=1 Tax=Psophocarpus tetragonolobus TaxID=3891 RepID=A0AAN9XAF1_PSOTE
MDYKTSASKCASFRYQIMSGRDENITRMDAEQFIKQVHYIFQEKMEKFDEFLQVMIDYKNDRIDVVVLIEKVEAILKEHRDLILGFNKFLPKGYQILLPSKGKPQMEDALNYLNKVQTRFQDDDHVYKSFLNILARYRNGCTPIHMVYQEGNGHLEESPMRSIDRSDISWNKSHGNLHQACSIGVRYPIDQFLLTSSSMRVGFDGRVGEDRYCGEMKIWDVIKELRVVGLSKMRFILLKLKK